MRINNNLSALTSFNALNNTNSKLTKTIQQLSTGLRINSAADDAAGFAISTKMRSQISGLDVARRNSMDGISMLETAEGALGNTNAMLQRMRELAVQASNDTLTSNDRRYIQMEINELKDEIDRIAGTTQFNRKRILDGSSGAMWSSSDVGLKARINGGLTYTDDFGQKVSSEGNYRIEVESEPGQGQVQKSNIFEIGYEEVVTKTEVVQKITGYTPPQPYEININTGIDSLCATSGDGWEYSNGILTITGNGTYKIVGTGASTTNHILVNSGVNATVFLKDVNISTNTFAFDMRGANVDMYLEGTNSFQSGWHCSGIEVSSNAALTISSANGDYSTSGTLIAKGAMHGAGIGGSCSSGYADAGNITILGGTIEATGGQDAAGIGGGSNAYARGGSYGNITICGGDVKATGGDGGAGIGSGGFNSLSAPIANIGNIVLRGGVIEANGGASYSDIYEVGAGAGIGGGGSFNSGSIEINNSASITVSGYTDTNQILPIGYGEGGIVSDVTFKNMILDPARPIPAEPTTTQPITEQEVTVTTSIKSTYSTLKDTSCFYNASGTFLVSKPQTITITQGDGQTASVTLYETDTMPEVAEKINDAISNTLGQGKYTDNPNKFCTIADGTVQTSETVRTREKIYDGGEEVEYYDNPDASEVGDILSRTTTTTTKGYDVRATMLVRSAIPGKAGELYFSGDQDILNALGLNTIQESQESTFTASIYDAHSGAPVNVGVKSTGSEFMSLIPPDIDIQVDHMAGISASWDESTKRFMLVRSETYTAMLHLKDNGTVFQTGANTGEDFVVQLGDASCNALRISGVNVVTRETASAAISTIDRAINKISSQRAKIGAYTNALEHTMTALTTTSANLTASESRIRDTDMAKTMMEFVKLNILNQSGTSMLAQANQLPQSVLNLMQ